MSETDWRALRGAYAQGDMSYRALAEKHGVPLGALKRTAAREQWARERRLYRMGLAGQGGEETEDGDGLAGLRAAASRMVDCIAEALGDDRQFNRHLIGAGRRGEPDTEERIFAKMDTRAVRDLTTALKDMTAIMRDLYGQPNRQEQSAMDIAAKRLQLEQKKAETENAAGDKEVVVRFEGGESGWSE